MHYRETTSLLKALESTEGKSAPASVKAIGGCHLASEMMSYLGEVNEMLTHSSWPSADRN